MQLSLRRSSIAFDVASDSFPRITMTTFQGAHDPWPFLGSPLLLLTLPRSDHHIEGLHPSPSSFIQAHALISLNSSRTKEARVNSIPDKMFTLEYCSLIPGVDFPLLSKHLFGARDELQYIKAFKFHIVLINTDRWTEFLKHNILVDLTTFYHILHIPTNCVGLAHQSRESIITKVHATIMLNFKFFACLAVWGMHFENRITP